MKALIRVQTYAVLLVSVKCALIYLSACVFVFLFLYFYYTFVVNKRTVRRPINICVIVISVKNTLNSLILTFDLSTKHHIISRISQGHSLYQVWILWDRSFWVMLRTNRQTNRQTDRRSRTYYQRRPTTKLSWTKAYWLSRCLTHWRIQDFRLGPKSSAEGGSYRL